jgi:exodeoxyribonuclease VII large subunit
MSVLHRHQETAEQLLIRSKQAMLNNIQNQHAILNGQAETLEALSPLKTLTRGYAVVTTEDNRTIQSVEQVQVGDQISVRLKDGKIQSKITEVDTEIGDIHG